MSEPSTAVSKNSSVPSTTGDIPRELIGGVAERGVGVRTPESSVYSCRPTPPDTDTTEYQTLWSRAECTPLTDPVRWNSWELEKPLPDQENTNRDDRLVASRNMLPSEADTRDRELAAVVAMLDTRSNLDTQQ